MTDTSTSENKSLIILGNGADVHSGLHTSFEEFMAENDKIQKIESALSSFKSIRHKISESFFKPKIDESLKELNQKMDSLKGLTFWEILLVVRECSDKSWYDIEKCMKDFLLLKDVKPHPGYTAPEWIDLDIQNFKDLKFELKVNSDEYAFIIYALIYLFNVHPKKEDNFHCIDLLKNQLYEFENRFSNYVHNDLNHITYNKYFKEIDHLFESLMFHSNNKKANILNFNYTPTRRDSPIVNKYQNIHGMIQTQKEQKKENKRKISDVVFGIDSNLSYPKLSSQKAKDDIYFFTKTRRILSRPFKCPNVLEDDINEIIFYGHSLGESDYSYFQSIFDHYNLYNSDLSLKFGFSVHGGHSLDDSIEKQSNRVSKLINKYGETLDNKDHAKNLLHKLLIENRLSIFEIKNGKKK